MEVPLDISSQGSGREWTIWVRGEIDFATAPRFDDAIQKLIEQGAADLTFDFHDVTFLDSEGLKVLLRTQRLVRERGGSIRLTHISKTVSRAFEVLGLESRFEIDSQQ